MVLEVGCVGAVFVRFICAFCCDRGVERSLQILYGRVVRFYLRVEGALAGAGSRFSAWRQRGRLAWAFGFYHGVGVGVPEVAVQGFFF